LQKNKISALFNLAQNPPKPFDGPEEAMKNLFLFIFVTFLSTSVCPASEAMLNYYSSLGGYATGTAGWTFTPNTSVSVTALGVFDYIYTTASQSPVSVGLWDQNGTLLTSSSVASDSLLFNNTRYESVAPVNLSSGLTYYIGAYAPSGSIILSAESPNNVDFPGWATTSPEIQLGKAVTDPSGFGFPNTDAGAGSGSAFLAPNFQYVNAVPEPSTGALFILSAALFAKNRIKRKVTA
jgi:hypothetical protein